MMNNPLKQLPQWISNHQKRKIQRIAYQLWKEDGKKKEPTYWLGPKNHYYQLKASRELHSERQKLLPPIILGIPPFLKNLLQSFETLSKISIPIALIIFLATEQQRRNAEIYQAWQVITAVAPEQGGSGGRKEALEFLNSTPSNNYS